MKNVSCKTTNPNIRRVIFDLVKLNGWPTDGGNFDDVYVTGHECQYWGTIAFRGVGFGMRNTPEGTTPITPGAMIDIVSEKYVPPAPISKVVKLNSEYEATVYADKVEVGCQSFPWTKIEEIIAAQKTLTAK